MYIFELILKQFKKESKEIKKSAPVFYEEISETEDDCEHIFMPIDSSGETFACRNCGLVVNKTDLQKKNIFAN